MYLLTVLTQNLKPLYSKPLVFSHLEDALRYVHRELVRSKRSCNTKFPWRTVSWESGRVQLVFLMPKPQEKEALEKLQQNFQFLQNFRMIEILYQEILPPVFNR